MRSRRASTHDLRTAIDCLPRDTREAMLDGIRSEAIIVGAYVDREGGVCPMLAAHRRGARTDFLPFARAWDRYTRASRARRASQRELNVLIAHLEASIYEEEFKHVDLGDAIADHRALTASSQRERRARPGDRHRAPELRGRGGWSWLRPFRALDEFERAVAQAQEQHAAAQAAPDAPDAERELTLPRG